jgi:hypothetical protein
MNNIEYKKIDNLSNMLLEKLEEKDFSNIKWCFASYVNGLRDLSDDKKEIERNLNTLKKVNDILDKEEYYKTELINVINTYFDNLREDKENIVKCNEIIEKQLKEIEEIKVAYLRKSLASEIEIEIRKIDKNTGALIEKDIYFYSEHEKVFSVYGLNRVYIAWRDRGCLAEVLKELKENNVFDYICVSENLTVNKNIRETYKDIKDL